MNYLRPHRNVTSLFKRWDANADRSVSRVEFRNAVRKLYGLHAFDEELDAVFDELDRDRSGEITASELTAQLQRVRVEPFGVAKRKLRATGRTDANRAGSGQLTTSGRRALDASRCFGGHGTAEQRLATIGKQLTHFLRSHAGSVGDLFREWDIDGNGMVAEEHRTLFDTESRLPSSLSLASRVMLHSSRR